MKVIKIILCLLVIIIGTCLASYSINTEPFSNVIYGRGDDFLPQSFMSNECPVLSCINQPCISSYET